MDTKFNIVFSKHAELQIIKIFEYITDTLINKDAADSLMAKFDMGFDRVATFPNMCPVSDFDGYRKLVIGNYVALYRVDEPNKTIFVVAVHHATQDYSRDTTYM